MIDNDSLILGLQPPQPQRPSDSSMQSSESGAHSMTDPQVHVHVHTDTVDIPRTTGNTSHNRHCS
ncbi:hypothetical protein SERLA73DRAFT_141440 [Serpula lacrymans var. lacrymans S7.3]|uniref:Uncharacterized protein n=2 Tax=Serpula lacrymans var. lacrymans TaxID=341189 RepID=F8Q6E4_SERL3|nr:uncharacterized protein SERLADRAFT_397000 [Serpula lacrymans var. lacrymans S7.9]EGN96182.1 hypothetical protein SERLA73DRAFT_141440 [Serpula lacrymans var. lacrymans S7.3]EGO21725.1 hypothetical protein SERLADRAFT_397000 [Serpula lacrymans var. lacrymans S7.9]